MAKEKLGYYDALKIAETASQKEIEQAYKKLAHQFHPDKIPDESLVELRQIAESRFKEINEAYAVLKDPSKRKRYDAGMARYKAHVEAGKKFWKDKFRPILEINQSEFQYPNRKKEETIVESIILSNVGGGNLQGTIESDADWLAVSQDKIEEKLHRQRIYFTVKPAKLAYGEKRAGALIIKSNDRNRKISVFVSVEVPEVAFERFQKKITPALRVAFFSIGCGLGFLGRFSFSYLAYGFGALFIFHFIKKSLTLFIFKWQDRLGKNFLLWARLLAAGLLFFGLYVIGRTFDDSVSLYNQEKYSSKTISEEVDNRNSEKKTEQYISIDLDKKKKGERGKINIRKSPSLTAKVLLAINVSEGEKFVILETDKGGGWYKISYEKTTGWISAKLGSVN